jgi:hypothetical protein
VFARTRVIVGLEKDVEEPDPLKAGRQGPEPFEEE